jgi:hypothetical protein
MLKVRDDVERLLGDFVAGVTSLDDLKEWVYGEGWDHPEQERVAVLEDLLAQADAGGETDVLRSAAARLVDDLPVHRAVSAATSQVLSFQVGTVTQHVALRFEGRSQQAVLG